MIYYCARVYASVHDYRCNVPILYGVDDYKYKRNVVFSALCSTLYSVAHSSNAVRYKFSSNRNIYSTVVNEWTNLRTFLGKQHAMMQNEDDLKWNSRGTEFISRSSVCMQQHRAATPTVNLSIIRSERIEKCSYDCVHSARSMQHIHHTYTHLCTLSHAHGQHAHTHTTQAVETQWNSIDFILSVFVLF